MGEGGEEGGESANSLLSEKKIFEEYDVNRMNADSTILCLSLVMHTLFHELDFPARVALSVSFYIIQLNMLILIYSHL